MNAVSRKVGHIYYPTQEVVDGVTTPPPIARERRHNAQSEKKKSNARKESRELQSAMLGVASLWQFHKKAMQQDMGHTNHNLQHLAPSMYFHVFMPSTS